MIRKDILNAYVSTLGAVTVANGYLQTLTSVEVLAKDWAHNDIDTDSLPYACVVPGDEVPENLPFGYQEIVWPIRIIVHFALQTRTAAGLLEECEQIRTDIRRALAATINLDVLGVMWIRPLGAETSTASETAIEHGLGGVIIKTETKFRESLAAAT